MWYVEGIWNWNTGEKERYEGLTEEQSRAVHQTMFASGKNFRGQMINY